MVDTYEQRYSSTEWLDKGVEDVDGKTIGYIEVITPGYNTDTYNLIWFTDVDEKMLSCIFLCAIGEMDEWQPVAHEIKNSFRVK